MDLLRLFQQGANNGDGGDRRRLVFYILGGILVVALLLSIPRVIHRYHYFFAAEGIEGTLYQDLGLGKNLSNFLSIILGFIYAAAWLVTIHWIYRVAVGRYDSRQFLVAFACWVYVYGHAPLLRVIGGADICFNQATGEPQKWYVVNRGGIVLYDSPGFSAGGLKKEVVTREVCRLYSLQRSGGKPREITGARACNLEFFETATGTPRVWYSRSTEDSYQLFDAGGFNPETSDPLSPASKEIIPALKAQAEKTCQNARQAIAREVEDGKERKAEQRDKEAKLVRQKHLDNLKSIFDPDSYSPDVLLLGAIGDEKKSSIFAAQKLLNYLANLPTVNLQPVDFFRSEVYSKGYFDKLINGNISVLDDVGLSEKIRGALLARVSVDCRSSVEHTKSCTMETHSRLLTGNDKGSVVVTREVGVGLSMEQAIMHAIELTFQRNRVLVEKFAR